MGNSPRYNPQSNMLFEQDGDEICCQMGKGSAFVLCIKYYGKTLHACVQRCELASSPGEQASKDNTIPGFQNKLSLVAFHYKTPFCLQSQDRFERAARLRMQNKRLQSQRWKDWLGKLQIEWGELLWLDTHIIMNYWHRGFNNTGCLNERISSLEETDLKGFKIN